MSVFSKNTTTKYRLLLIVAAVFVLGAVAFVDNGLRDDNTVPAKTTTYTSKPAQTTVDENALHECRGNPSDQCIATPSVDFWPSGSEGASNPAFNQTKNPIHKEVMGRITSTVDSQLTLTTSSGRTIIVQYPLNAVQNFNDKIAPNYNFTVGTGDMLYVNYSQANGSDPTGITTDQIFQSSIIMKGQAKSDAGLSKY